MSKQPSGVPPTGPTSEAVLQAFSEPNRRTMLELVAVREMPAGEIASHFNVTRQAVSQHLRVLKEAGLVDERRAGRQRLYRARAEGIAVLQRYLNALWFRSLELAKDITESVEDDAGPDKAPSDP